MSSQIKTKKTFGTATIDHFSPAKQHEWPKAINVTLSFEEAMRLHLGLGQLLGKLGRLQPRHQGGPPVGGEPVRLHPGPPHHDQRRQGQSVGNTAQNTKPPPRSGQQRQVMA